MRDSLKSRKLKCGNPKPCVVCGGSVPVFYSSCKSFYGGRRYRPRKPTCSYKCAIELLKSRKRPKKKCPECGVLFWPRTNGSKPSSNYCSNRCRLAHDTKRRWIPVECHHCHRRFTKDRCQVFRKRRKTARVFCSKRCVQLFHVGENSPLFRGDKDPNRGAEWNRLAETIRVRDSHQCRRCGRSQLENRQKLSVDHVRPWREFTDKKEANDPSNLVALCRKCHSLKTLTTEQAWLRGDGLALQRYRKEVGIIP